MPPPRLEFWFEFASTYSYLSALRIDDLAAKAGVEVDWQPFWLGPIFRAMGWQSSPFNEYPAKGQYMWRDMERLCIDRGLPFVRPDPFPQNSLLAARTACLAVQQPGGPGFVRAVYRAEFGDGANIADPDLLRRLLAEAGLPETLVDEAEEQPAKDALKGQVERAMAMGLFGAPSFVVGQEVFWGDDRLEQALDWAASRQGSLQA